MLSNSDRSPIWCFCSRLVQLCRTRRPCSTSRARMASRRLLFQLDLVASVEVPQVGLPNTSYFCRFHVPVGPFESGPRYPRCSRISTFFIFGLSFFDWSWLYGQFFDHFHSQHVSDQHSIIFSEQASCHSRCHPGQVAQVHTDFGLAAWRPTEVQALALPSHPDQI